MRRDSAEVSGVFDITLIEVVDSIVDPEIVRSCQVQRKKAHHSDRESVILFMTESVHERICDGASQTLHLCRHPSTGRCDPIQSGVTANLCHAECTI